MPVVLSWSLAVFCIANGLAMLAQPDTWYLAVPGVTETGPFNPHFVRDIGCAYLAAGAGFAWFAVRPAGRAAAAFGAGFLTLHALVHVWDTLAGREALARWVTDMPAVVAPALLALLLVVVNPAKETRMLNWIMRRRIDAFEKAYDYDMSYVRDILAASPTALRRFARAASLAQWRGNLPPAPWFTAKLVAAMHDDCGACTQLVVTMAEREGVAPSAIRAILARNEAGLSSDLALVARFASAVLEHDPEADELREKVRAAWGADGLIALALAIASARLFPTVKYALGHGRSCSTVSVGGVVAPVRVRAFGHAA